MSADVVRRSNGGHSGGHALRLPARSYAVRWLTFWPEWAVVALGRALYLAGQTRGAVHVAAKSERKTAGRRTIHSRRDNARRS